MPTINNFSSSNPEQMKELAKLVKKPYPGAVLKGVVINGVEHAVSRDELKAPMATPASKPAVVAPAVSAPKPAEHKKEVKVKK
jgi:hypothetical protein